MKIQIILIAMFSLFLSLALVSATENYCIGDSVYYDVVLKKCPLNCMFGTCLGNNECTTYTNQKLQEKCANGCEDGKCIQTHIEIKCSKDSDCNDNKAKTQDKCINPGKISSRCENKDLSNTCYQDADCGTNSYTGAKFCKNDNVYQKYLSFSCIKSDCGKFTLGCYFGKEDNKCSSKTNDVLMEECDYGCDNGMCKNKEEIKCSSDCDCGQDGFIGDKFCEGKDVKQTFKEFTCNNKGTTQSFCSSSTFSKLIESCADECTDGTCTTNPIVCSRSLDCGIDSYIGDKFCEGNSVFRNLKTFKCSNPGTSLSSCSNLIVKIKQTTCLSGEICQLGICIKEKIICSKDTDCGTNVYLGTAFCNKAGNALYNSFKQFKCLNPATPQSFCTDSVFDKLLWNCPVYCKDSKCISCLPDEKRACSSSKCLYGAYEYCQAGGSYGSCTCLPAPQCKDGLDNDGDGKYDYPADPQCFDKWDNDESK